MFLIVYVVWFSSLLLIPFSNCLFHGCLFHVYVCGQKKYDQTVLFFRPCFELSIDSVHFSTIEWQIGMFFFLHTSTHAHSMKLGNFFLSFSLFFFSFSHSISFILIMRHTSDLNYLFLLRITGVENATLVEEHTINADIMCWIKSFRFTWITWTGRIIRRPVNRAPTKSRMVKCYPMDTSNSIDLVILIVRWRCRHLMSMRLIYHVGSWHFHFLRRKKKKLFCIPINWCFRFGNKIVSRRIVILPLAPTAFALDPSLHHSWRISARRLRISILYSEMRIFLPETLQKIIIKMEISGWVDRTWTNLSRM